MSDFFDFLVALGLWNLLILALVISIAIVVYRSIRNIGPTEVGLVRRRFSAKKLPDDNPIAFHGEAGYEAELMMPGVQFKLWPLYDVTRHPMVQIPAGQIGVVIAQVGAPLPVGAKSAAYKPAFGNFQDHGESYRLEKVGRAGAVKTEAEGLAVAKGREAPQRAVGRDQTALINAIRALADGRQRFVPETLALSVGGEASGSLNSLVPMLMRWLNKQAANDTSGDKSA
ncbi:MAG: hypothetical protein ISQ86_14130 [Alphaproteobacteria bacterium]|nr:hypothetical protein [Alphaproteobacteria bacterium]